ncbi:MAG: hypothetical protein ACXWCB_13010 [Acidimicrobiales bacterium]
MSAGWVAGGVRARLLTRRRLGRDGIRSLAEAGSAGELVRLLAASPYGHDVDETMDLAAARHAVARTSLWHLRVLAGWLTPHGAETVRLVAGWYEIADIEAHVAELSGSPSRSHAAASSFELGALAVAWPRVRAATSPSQVRAILASSPWGDPGGTTAAEIAVGLRFSWARRLRDGVRVAEAWAAGDAALTLARETLVFGRSLTTPATAEAVRVLGRAWSREPWATPDELASLLPREARWALEGIDDPAQLWLAEVAWQRRVEDEALRLVASAQPGPDVVAAAAMLLLVDAWRVRAALEAVAWGGIGREVLRDAG